MSLNISDFRFLCKNCKMPWKNYPLLSSNSLLKVEVLPSPVKVEVSPPPPPPPYPEESGVYTMINNLHFDIYTGFYRDVSGQKSVCLCQKCWPTFWWPVSFWYIPNFTTYSTILEKINWRCQTLAGKGF